MAQSKHTEARYDMQEVEMGQVYTLHPESVEVVCSCGERLTFTASSKTTCGGCGADHEGAAEEGLEGKQLGDKAAHPWNYGEDREDLGLQY